MDDPDATDLGRALSVGTSVGDPGTSHCGLCETDLDGPGGSVEVKLRDETAATWLCPPCYEYVVGDMGIAPLRVFKTGPHRTVVLPDVPGTTESGSD